MTLDKNKSEKSVIKFLLSHNISTKDCRTFNYAKDIVSVVPYFNKQKIQGSPFDVEVDKKLNDKENLSLIQKQIYDTLSSDDYIQDCIVDTLLDNEYTLDEMILITKKFTTIGFNFRLLKNNLTLNKKDKKKSKKKLKNK